jgi:cation diffusion facilitator family transporter
MSSLSNADFNIRIQRYILLGGVVLFLIKCLAFFLTNSVGILSDALESTVNIITGFLTLKSLQYVARPRDHDHPYGHGKAELITASVEGIMIAVAGVLIIVEAVKRMNHPPLVSKLDTGIILMVVTAIVNFAMGRYSLVVGKKRNSIALISGGQHLMSDMLTTLALASGLIIYHITGLQWIDSVLALIFGLIIIYTGYNVLKTTINGLMDEADEAALDTLVSGIRSGRDVSWVNIHKLTCLKFGHVSHVDLHLTLPWYYNISEANNQIHGLKQLIRSYLPDHDVDISIQAEPCQPAMCSSCSVECIHRSEAQNSNQDWSRETLTGNNRYSIHQKDKQNA